MDRYHKSVAAQEVSAHAAQASTVEGITPVSKQIGGERRLGAAQAGGDQAIKFEGSSLTDKTPAQMGVAGGAEHNLPGMAGKPGELSTCCTLQGSAGRTLKTTDFKGNTSWIEEGMLVAAIDTDSLVLAGD